MTPVPETSARATYPAPELLSLLVCPLCKQQLQQSSDALLCSPCGKSFPIILGVPDLRVYPDPYISFEQDHLKGRQVHEQASRLNFAELLLFYWENVSKPPTPLDLCSRFIRHILSDEERVARLPIAEMRGAACLDVGCGASAMLQHAQRRFGLAIGADVAFRWMFLARKRLEEAGLPAHLVCCCADYLPFRSETFDVVTSVSALEHMSNAHGAVSECGRVTTRGGKIFLLTTNRFSLAPEPHVRLWGVGFLPRSWMPAYVRWRRGLAYDKHHLLSYFEVRRFLRASGMASVRFSLPEIVPADLEHRGAAERTGARVFGALTRIPGVRWLLQVISPVVQALATK